MVHTLVKFLYAVIGLELMPVVVAVIQTFRDRIKFHPHIHILITEGGVSPDGAFHHVSCFLDEVIQQIFTHKVSSLLLRKRIIGLSLVQNILRWHPSGFNVHSQVKTQNKSDAERIAKYMIRPVLSLKRLFLDEAESKIRYQFSRNDSQEEPMDYLEFIARVTSHVRDKGQVMVRYYGRYSNAHRGQDAKGRGWSFSSSPHLKTIPLMCFLKAGQR